jgi:hypothetical protein
MKTKFLIVLSTVPINTNAILLAFSFKLWQEEILSHPGEEDAPEVAEAAEAVSGSAGQESGHSHSSPRCLLEVITQHERAQAAPVVAHVHAPTHPVTHIQNMLNQDTQHFQVSKHEIFWFFFARIKLK